MPWLTRDRPGLIFFQIRHKLIITYDLNLGLEYVPRHLGVLVRNIKQVQQFDMNTSTSQNPYNAPADEKLNQALGNNQLIFGSLKLIVISGLMFGAFGALIGWVLAVLTPGYYRSVFNADNSDIWQIGVGLGLTQGLFAGLVVGCVVVLAAAWYRSRVKTGILREIHDFENHN